jgi:hypothetical protein
VAEDKDKEVLFIIDIQGDRSIVPELGQDYIPMPSSLPLEGSTVVTGYIGPGYIGNLDISDFSGYPANICMYISESLAISVYRPTLIYFTRSPIYPESLQTLINNTMNPPKRAGRRGPRRTATNQQRRALRQWWNDDSYGVRNQKDAML